MDEPVQDGGAQDAPAESQGGETTGGLFDTYLQQVPDDARETVTQYLKDAEKNVNQRLQDAAEANKFKEQYEPYAQLGLDQYNPEDLQQLLEWHQSIAGNEDAFKQWHQQIGEELGLTPKEVDQAIADGTLEEPGVDEQVQKMLDERLAPIEQSWQQQQQEQQTNELAATIRTTLDKLESDTPLPGDPGSDARNKAEQRVMDLAMKYEGDDWVQKGFAEYQEILAEAQKQFVSNSAGQPATPETGGHGTPGQEPATDWKTASAQARERLQQALAG